MTSQTTSTTDIDAAEMAPAWRRLTRIGDLSTEAIRTEIASWHDIPESRRRNWASSFNVADGIVRRMEVETGIAPATERWRCRHLNAVLWQKPAAFHGLADRRFGDVAGHLRRILIRLGVHAETGTGLNKLAPAWQALMDRVPQPERKRGLVRFFRFLTLVMIEPEEVTSHALEDFATWLGEETLTDDIPALVRRTASNWMWAMREIPGWPQVELRRPGMRDEFTTPIERFPESFQQDVARFLDGLRGRRLGGVYRAPGAAFREVGHDGKGARGRRNRAHSPRTVKTRAEQIRAAAAALLHQGVAIESMISLRDLVSPPERPRQILEFHLGRLEARKPAAGRRDADGEDADPTSGYVSALADVLRMIATHHVDLPEPEVEEILHLRAAVRPDAQGTMNEDVARKLRALNERDTLAMLVHLPEEWIRRLPSLRLRPRGEALIMMHAIALEVLLAVPLRRRNLVELHLDRHLVVDHHTGAVTGLNIPAHATKTRKRPIVWEFSPRVATMIGTFVKNYRPLLADKENRYLFPGNNGKHREIGNFATDLSRRVESEIGVDFNLHLIRHLTAYRLLKRLPGSYELVSRVLGHSSPKTTMTYYCGLEMIFAVREASRLLELDRIEANRPPARFAVARGRVRARRRQGMKARTTAAKRPEADDDPA